MTKLIVAVCDHCGAQAPLRDTGYGHDVPMGWVLLKEVGVARDPSLVEPVLHLCSWACVEQYGRTKDLAPREATTPH